MYLPARCSARPQAVCRPRSQRGCEGFSSDAGEGQVRRWCLGPGSNQRPPPYEGDALPAELPRQMAEQVGLEPTIRASPNTRLPSGPATNYHIAPCLCFYYMRQKNIVFSTALATRVGVEPTGPRLEDHWFSGPAGIAACHPCHMAERVRLEPTRPASAGLLPG